MPLGFSVCVRENPVRPRRLGAARGLGLEIGLGLGVAGVQAGRARPHPGLALKFGNCPTGVVVAAAGVCVSVLRNTGGAFGLPSSVGASRGKSVAAAFWADADGPSRASAASSTPAQSLSEGGVWRRRDTFKDPSSRPARRMQIARAGRAEDLCFPINASICRRQARRRPAGQARQRSWKTWLMEIKRIWLTGRCRIAGRPIPRHRSRPGIAGYFGAAIARSPSRPPFKSEWPRSECRSRNAKVESVERPQADGRAGGCADRFGVTDAGGGGRRCRGAAGFVERWIVARHSSARSIASRPARGRVIVTGMGKSGHVGGKIAATMASTGTPAFFVHPGEASHGDLGMITPDDVIMALSWSGETAELKDLIDYSRRFRIGLAGDDREWGMDARPSRRHCTDYAAGARSLPARSSPPPPRLFSSRSGTRLPSRCWKAAASPPSISACCIRAAASARSSNSCATSCTQAGDSAGAARHPMSEAVVGNVRPGVLVVSASLTLSGLIIPGIITDGDLRRHMGPDLLTGRSGGDDQGA